MDTASKATSTERIKQRKKLQIVLDILMTATVLTLFDKSMFGMQYHKVAGILLIFGIIAHILLNLKTMRGMQKNFLRIPADVRICLIVDILLILVYFLEGISGVLIGKKLAIGLLISTTTIKLVHFFMAALSVILLGVHIGLHIGRKKMPTVAAIALTVISLSLGAYGLSNSNMLRWLSIPYSITQIDGSQGPAAQAGVHTDVQADIQDDVQGSEQADLQKEADYGTAVEIGSNKEKKNGNGAMKGPEMHADKTWTDRLTVIAEYFGMIFSFSMAAYWMMHLRKKQKNMIN